MEELNKSPRAVPLAVLLDFDGVVVDSLALHLDAWREATLTTFGRPLPSVEDLVGRGTRAIAGLIATRMGDPSLAASLVRVKQAWLAAHLDRVELLPGVHAFLDGLHARALPHGIASNSTGVFVRGVLAATGLGIQHVVAGDEVPRGKPHPGIYWELANRLGVAPEDRHRVLVIEDSTLGLEAAVKAGMVPLGLTSAHAPEILLAAGAVAVCAHLGDALAQGWLDRVPITSPA